MEFDRRYHRHRNLQRRPHGRAIRAVSLPHSPCHSRPLRIPAYTILTSLQNPSNLLLHTHLPLPLGTNLVHPFLRRRLPHRHHHWRPPLWPHPRLLHRPAEPQRVASLCVLHLLHARQRARCTLGPHTPRRGVEGVARVRGLPAGELELLCHRCDVP